MNGRGSTILNGVSYLSERETAKALGIKVMRLRRSAPLQIHLGKVKVNMHPYYREDQVNLTARALEGYVLRTEMLCPPQTMKERERQKETVIYGLVCYPKARKK